MTPLDAHVTLFERANRPDGPMTDVPLGRVLEAIHLGRYADEVAAVRAEPDPDRRKALKLHTLPALAPSGTFTGRRSGGLLEHSGVVVLDLDDAPDLDALRADVNARAYVAASFASPSWTGLKPLVPVVVVDPETGEMRAPRDAEEHAEAWRAVAALFESGASAGLVDPSGKDVARACYLSHDPDLYLNPDAEPVVVELGSGDSGTGADKPPRTSPRERAREDVPLTLSEIEHLLGLIPPPAESGDYDHWISVYANLIAFCEDNGHTGADARAVMERWSPARGRDDYPERNRGLDRGHAGAFVNLLKRSGLDYSRWLRERYRRLRGEDSVRGHVSEPPRSSVLDIRTGAEWIEAVAGQPEPRPLWGPLWFEGETTIYFAETNVGKSVSAVQIGEAIASGRSLPGFPCEAEPQKVLYLDFELSGKQWERRYSDGFRDHYAFHPNFHRAELDPDALTDEDSFDLAVREAIEAAVIEHGYRVVIVDNLTFLGRQSQEAKDALPLMRDLHRLKRTYGLSMLVLGHTPKRDGSRPLTLNDLGGSRHLANFADAVVALGRSAREPNVRYVKQLKVRSAELEYHADNVAVLGLEKPSNFLGFRLLDYGPEEVHLRDKTDAEKGQRDAAILDLHAEGRSYREIAAQLAISKNTAMKVVQRAQEGEAPPPTVPTRPLYQGEGTGTAHPNKDLGVPRSPRGTPGTAHGDGRPGLLPDLDVPEWGDAAPL